jgi:acetyltransferase-like isoleucine patch superfamily enzyme
MDINCWIDYGVNIHSGFYIGAGAIIATGTFISLYFMVHNNIADSPSNKDRRFSKEEM